VSPSVDAAQCSTPCFVLQRAADRVAVAECVCVPPSTYTAALRFDVRCCCLSPEFIEALRHVACSGGASCAAGCCDGTSTAGQAHSSSTGAESSVQEALRCYRGCTPLAPEGAGQPAGDDVGPTDCLAAADGFSSPFMLVRGKALSWSNVLSIVGAQAGSWLTVILMERSNLGSLWEAIKTGVFQPAHADDANSQRRTSALLRTAQEIAAVRITLSLCQLNARTDPLCTRAPAGPRVHAHAQRGARRWAENTLACQRDLSSHKPHNFKLHNRSFTACRRCLCRSEARQRPAEGLARRRTRLCHRGERLLLLLLLQPWTIAHKRLVPAMVHKAGSSLTCPC
jgi:hypothetical protein